MVKSTVALAEDLGLIPTTHMAYHRHTPLNPVPGIHYLFIFMDIKHTHGTHTYMQEKLSYMKYSEKI